MKDFWLNYGKIVSLLGGFLSTMVGLFWSFLVASKVDAEAKGLSNRRTAITHQIERLNALASEYFLANQQGDMIFILSFQDNARADIAALVHKANLLDRATPVRSMVGELAIEGQLDYGQIYGEYKKLNELARDDFSSIERYQKLRAKEQVIIQQGQERAVRLFSDATRLDAAIQANEAAQRRGRWIGFVAAITGSFLLLAANLSAERYKIVPREATS